MKIRALAFVLVALSPIVPALAMQAGGHLSAGPPPPVVVQTDGHTWMAPRQRLLTWQVGAVRCGTATPVFALPPEPYASSAWGNEAMPAPPVGFAFGIDADGRPIGIKRDIELYAAGSQDLAPALAAARFAAGQPQADCRIAFTPVRTPFADAPIRDVTGFTVFPDGTPPKDAFDRTRPPGSTCFDPPPAVLLRAYPRFKTISQLPGTASWSMIGFDIAASGKPVRVAVTTGSGNAALDRAAIDAVRASRFEPGARQGCIYPYYRRGEALAAPAMPKADAAIQNGADCPQGNDSWATKPILLYPQPYRRRNIEGWAVIGFDVAPWGQTGNIRVLASEPSADFGQAATQVIRAATKPASGRGYAGCVERVRYVMGKPGMVPNTSDVPPPPF